MLSPISCTPTLPCEFVTIDLWGRQYYFHFRDEDAEGIIQLGSLGSEAKFVQIHKPSHPDTLPWVGAGGLEWTPSCAPHRCHWHCWAFSWFSCYWSCFPRLLIVFLQLRSQHAIIPIVWWPGVQLSIHRKHKGSLSFFKVYANNVWPSLAMGTLVYSCHLFSSNFRSTVIQNVANLSWISTLHIWKDKEICLLALGTDS